MFTWSYQLQIEELVTIKRQSISSNSSQWGPEANLFTEVLPTEYTPDSLILTFVRSVLRKTSVAPAFLQIIDVSRLLPPKGPTAHSPCCIGEVLSSTQGPYCVSSIFCQRTIPQA